MWTSLLQSRKSYSSSEENCPNSVWEAADFLHIHNPLLQVVCRTYDVSAMCYARGVCAACVQGRTWIFQECRGVNWTHWPGQISAVLPRQVKQTSGGWRRVIRLCEASGEWADRSSPGQCWALRSPTPGQLQHFWAAAGFWTWFHSRLMEICTFCFIGHSR